MTREEAIKGLEKLRSVADYWEEDTDKIALDMAIEALEYIKKNKDILDLVNAFAELGFDTNKIIWSAQEWIPCSERLPEEGVEVLCCFRNGDNYKIIVSKRMDFNYWSSVGRTGDTIAWMPLPPAYEGE